MQATDRAELEDTIRVGNRIFYWQNPWHVLEDRHQEY